MRSILPADCGRARQQLSLRLDSELSEFENVLLDAHLSRCEDCRAFEHGIVGMTDAIRAVPVESPAISFQPPRRRARLEVLAAGSLRAGSAAAAVAVVAITGLIAFNGPTQAGPTTDLARARAVLSLHERQLEQLEPRVAAVPLGLVAAERVAMPARRDTSRRDQGRR